MKLYKALVPVAIALIAAAPLQAQFYFGQNQVQYNRFDWQVWETEHFYVHYYPEMRQAALDAAQMAERSYARLSRILQHQFREKKPLILFSSRGHFGQNHVTGDLGEGVGGVTEALRHRVLLPFTGDYRSFERVLTHELVHSFQYDIYARGRAGGGIPQLQSTQPPLWFMEGMAEYLALGPNHPLTDAWIRDAAVNGRIPTMEQLKNPQDFFPYRFGEAVFQYIGEKWGDEAIGRVMQALPNAGIDRAIQRELGISSIDLGEDWREAMQAKHLPDIPNRERPRKFSEQLLSQRKSGGASEMFLAPSLSYDGKYIAFVGHGSFARGEVFMDLWLADAKTGKRLHRLVKSTLDPDFEELRLLYSQSAFSPDSRFLAFTAQKGGRDVLYLLDVEKRKTVREFKLPNLDGVTSPGFSPDGNRIVFSGTYGGTSDLYVVNVDGTGFERLTSDGFGDLMPQWSPDGRRIAFASERAPTTDYNILNFDDWVIALYDVESRKIEVIPDQGGLNLNPQWAPDGNSIAFISDRNGTANVFLYDLAAKQHYQLTNVVGAISAITEFSPALTWSRGADKLAYTYFDNGDYTVWTTSNPRRLKTKPYQEPTRIIVAEAPSAAAQPQDTAQRNTRNLDTSASDSMTMSFYRGAQQIRASGDLPVTPSSRAPVSIASLLDSADYALPDTTTFRSYKYRGTLEPEILQRPTIGYQPDNFGQSVYGQSMLIMRDLVGNHQLAVAGGLNGRISEAQFFGAYSNFSRRFQYMTGIQQQPYFYFNGSEIYDLGGGLGLQEERLTRYIWRQAFATAQYPFSRFSRIETGLNYNHVDRATMVVQREFTQTQLGQWYVDRVESEPGVSYVQPMAAYVYDNALFGYTGPIMGTLFRGQIQPAIGGLRWVNYLVDYRRYEPVIFNFLTFAVRGHASVSVGRDESQLPDYIGRPELLRGYNRQRFSQGCGFDDIAEPSCGAARLIGSRVAIANAEVRFPLVRAFALGLLPIALPPIDGLVFYDVGMAWNSGDKTSFLARVPESEAATTRYPLRSYGYGVRLNLYGLALLRWDYSIPLDLANAKKGFWTFSIGPSF